MTLGQRACEQSEDAPASAPCPMLHLCSAQPSGLGRYQEHAVAMWGSAAGLMLGTSRADNTAGILLGRSHCGTVLGLLEGGNCSAALSLPLDRTWR